MATKRMGRRMGDLLAVVSIVLAVAVTGFYASARTSLNGKSWAVTTPAQSGFTDTREPPYATRTSRIEADNIGSDAEPIDEGLGDQISHPTNPALSNRVGLPVEHQLLRDAVDDLANQMAVRASHDQSIKVAAHAAGSISQPTRNKGESK